MKARLSIAACGLISVSVLTAQVIPPPPPAGNHGKQAHSIEELLALGADAKAIVDQRQIDQFLAALSASDRQSVQRQLVNAANEQLATAAAHYEIKYRDTAAIGAIAARVPSWTSKAQSALLMAVSLPRDRFLDIARAVLRAGPAKPADPQPLNVALDSIGKAAVLLARTGVPSDAALIRNAARARPKSWGVWMAVAYGGLVDSSLATVATGVYTDSAVDLPTRVAAATALEPLAPQAAEFAVGQVQSFLAKFGDIDLSSVMIEATRARQNPSATPVTQIREHTTDFHLLASLLLLQAPAAKQLTLRSLSSKNFEIQLLCAIVAARRWPTDLLASGLSGFSPRREAELRALIAVNHPELAAQASAGILPDAMNSAKDLVSKVGIGVFGGPGIALACF